MQASRCALRVALKALRSFAIEHPLINSAESHLTLALSCAEAYETTKNSLYWNRSNESTKRKIREQLNYLAFDTYSNLLEAGSYLNQFMDDAKNTRIPVNLWVEMIRDLNLSADWMEKEHFQEINKKQLAILI